jgi:hypothetical protein
MDLRSIEYVLCVRTAVGQHSNIPILFLLIAFQGSKASLRFEKKQRRRLFIQERKDAAALEAQTQQPDVWYKVCYIDPACLVPGILHRPSMCPLQRLLTLLFHQRSS